MTWLLPLSTMVRVDDTTARLLAGTMTTHDPHTRTEAVPANSADLVLTPDQWRARHRKAAA